MRVAVVSRLFFSGSEFLTRRRHSNEYYVCVARDRCEDASDELENIEGLSVGQLEQVLIVRGFALVKESARAVGPMDA